MLIKHKANVFLNEMSFYFQKQPQEVFCKKKVFLKILASGPVNLLKKTPT